MSELQVVVFSLNEEFCGVETSQVQMIVKYQDITKVPKMPKFIEGIINYLGSVVPVVNLNKRFDFGDTEINRKTKIIIARVKDYLIGYIVNDVLEIIKLSEEDVEPAPQIIEMTGNNYLKNVGKKGDKLISILDLSRILDDTELKKLEKSKVTSKDTAKTA